MITAALLPWILGAILLAMLPVLWRLLRGPDALDRVLALDTLYLLAVLLLLLLEFGADTGVYFEAAAVVALLGFVSTLAAARYLARGRNVE